MKKIQIATLAREEEKLLQALQDEAVLQVVHTDGAETKEIDSQISYQLAQLQFVLELIERLRSELGRERKSSLRDMFVSKPVASLQELEAALASLDVEAHVAHAHETNKELTAIEAKRQQLEEALSHLVPWGTLRITGSDLRGTEQVRHMLLEVPIREGEFILKGLEDIPRAMFQEINRVGEKDKVKIYLELIVRTEDVATVEQLIADTGTNIITFDLNDNQSISQRIDALESEIKMLDERRMAVLQKGGDLIALEKDFKFVYDALLHRQEREIVQERAVRLPLSVILTGWVPASRFQDLHTILQERLEAVAVQEILPEEGEDPPVLLVNSPLLKPFESVTNIYGKPKYHELDPSGPLSLFFLVGFGLALTDAGYGIVMMIGTWAAQRFFRLKRDFRNMMQLLFLAGASTTLFGALTGGWFGIDLGTLPDGVVKQVLLSVKVIDPIAEPMLLLLVAFAVGVVQLLFAWVVRGYDHVRQNDWAAVLLDDVAWISMVVLILMWAASGRGFLPIAWEPGLWWAVIGNAVILILSQGRSHKNIFLRLGSGALSLYGLVTFMSDMLSYSRLLALGLATAIIALVVNLLGGMVAESIPVIGWLLAAVVLLVGHVFNLGINALGAFIHSGRLQFVEFFPKFVEGGGVPFKPFGRVSKYVDNPQEYA